MAALSPLRFVGQPPPRFSVIYGDEEQLVEEARLSVRAHFSADNIHRAAAETLAGSPLATNSGDLFGDQQPTLYEINVTTTPPPAVQDALVALAAHTQPPDAMLILIRGMEAKQIKTAWFKKISDGAVCVRADRLAATAAVEWLTHWAQTENLTLNDESMQLLAAQTEGNLYAAKQAMTKLTLTADNGDITAAAVRQTLADGAQYDIFDFGDAVLNGKGTRAIKILRQLRAAGVADPLILWSITDILNGVIALHAGESPRFWGARLAGLRVIAQRTSPQKLSDLLRRAGHADRVTKGVETGDIETALTHLVICLAALKRGVKISLLDFQ